MNQYYYSFSRYLREKFACRVHKISLNAGFNCPNLDGTLSTKGCIFCNNKAFARFAETKISLTEQIAGSMEYARKRMGAKKFIAYFQSFSSTYGEFEFLKTQYELIRKFDDIVGISISTRPDCIDEQKLDLIESFACDYEVYVEYGLQTVHDRILKGINRNHTFADFKKAVELTAKKNINIGVHLILGLLGETKEDMLKTAKVISTMGLWGVKFHCLHVVKDTGLKDMYDKAKIKLLSEDEYIDILIDFLELIPKEFVILRLVSDADRNLLTAPLWINNKQRVIIRIAERFKERNTYQGRLYESTCCKN